MLSNFERFLLPAKGYLNLGSANRSFAVSQNLVINLFSNANLTSQMFSSV